LCSAWRAQFQADLMVDVLVRAHYRVSQFLASLRPAVARDERAILALWLPPEAKALFWQMPRRDQRHSLDVYYTLRNMGNDQPDLLAAALLHDVGKSVGNGFRLRLVHRVLIVLLEATRPGWVAELASDDPTSWRYPLTIHLCHPEVGAQLALEAGCSQLTARLIARHQVKLGREPVDEKERYLALLQLADEVN
jgi:hypothetical protein